ncbi:LOW QUALITY PROTEIN: uncharacterized protein LOC114481864 [Xyrichtys novacula]|uniref:LOW QUALITY PROTEIN: uncharacterized protein LOC114481864 n=1 Tax=Xyrichtys novacula TaxID=13765 RepID=A0AAV1G979_XYRNO|nr:LOW QUALITY PROTEIN: uncharacterized protein LOC114481864 [Xyrichtys novacula]
MLMARQPDSPSEKAGVPDPPMPHLTPEEDTLSLAASATHFHEYGEDAEGSASQLSDPGSYSSDQSSRTETGDHCMRTVMRMALEHQNLDVPKVENSAPASAFFRRRPPPTAFAVPHSPDFLRELQASWMYTRAGSRMSADARTLAAMHNAAAVGLDHMPAVEPAIASLIVSPDEALRRETRCPRPQCRITDDLLVRAYDSGARAGRIGNSLSHLMLALSASLQEGDVGTGNARRQVWLSQSNLTEASRRTLRSLPVEPGTVFGSAAQEALERTIQTGQTRQQLASLRRMPPPSRPPSGRGHRGDSAPPGPRGPTGTQGEYRKELPRTIANNNIYWSVLEHHNDESLSPRRVDDMLNLLLLFRGGRRLPLLTFLRLLGKLTSVAAVVPLGLLSLQPLQRWLNSFHLDTKRHGRRRIGVSRQCLLALA